MLKLIEHRGPDNSSIYEYNGFCLGHRRLSIIDLETGDQPIFNNDKSACIVFNGEIYNYKLLADEFNPLLNRCIAGLYSPGSTYKLVTALHAIENQKFNKNKKFLCSGHVSFGNRKFHCWKKEGHGNVNLKDAIKKSCDCYFYNLAKNNENQM